MNIASITHDVYYPHAPERVWRALTSSDALAQWLMPNDFEPRVGHHFTFRTTPMPALGFDGVCRCEVTVCEPPRTLAYTWVGSALDTLVTFRLEPEGDGTRLYFEHSGFDLDDPMQQGSYRGLQGWKQGLDISLRRTLDEQAAQPASQA